MKVKNIVFSGFAAAILMGTVDASAAMSIASKDYVDGLAKISVAGTPTSVASIVEGMISGEDSVASQIDDAIDEALGDMPANTTVADALDGKQDVLGGANSAGVVVATTTPGDVTYTAIDTTLGNNSNLVTGASVKAYVDDAIDGVTGNGGSVGSQIDTALGSDFTGDNPAYSTVTDALADKLDKSATSSTLPAAASAVATNYANELAVATALAGKADASDLSALDGQINGNGGLADDVEELQTTVAGLTSGANSVESQISDALGSDFEGQNAYADVSAALADKQDTLSAAQLAAANSGITAEKVTAYDTKMTQLNGTCTSESDYCVLAKGQDGVMQWVEITLPFSVN